MSDSGDRIWVEFVSWDDDSYERRWLVEPPAKGVKYRITSETWLDEADNAVQLVHEWEPVQ